LKRGIVASGFDFDRQPRGASMRRRCGGFPKACRCGLYDAWQSSMEARQIVGNA
jgi:hypothetical protein